MSDPARAPRFVGLVTLVIGVALLLAPEGVGRRARLEPLDARLIGAADLALVPGLLVSRRPAPWMAARAVLNVLIAAAYLARVGPRHPRTARVAAGTLGALTLADTRVVVALRQEAPAAV